MPSLPLACQNLKGAYGTAPSTCKAYSSSDPLSSAPCDQPQKKELDETRDFRECQPTIVASKIYTCGWPDEVCYAQSQYDPA